jgi:acyl carrier protein
MRDFVAKRQSARQRRGCEDGREQDMSTFDVIADIFAETCSLDRDAIKPESNVIEDLNVDSLDFLDVTFAIDRKFGIKLPVERWTEEISEGKAKMEDYFVLGNLVRAIDNLVEANKALG